MKNFDLLHLVNNDSADISDNRRRKYLDIANLIEHRITRGNYTLRPLPSEDALAREVGVSRMTARKALNSLLEKGILQRPRHGRLKITERRGSPANILQFAFLSRPTWSNDVQMWQQAVEQVAGSSNGILRTVNFVEWTDVQVLDVFREFDGVFLMQSGHALPLSLLQWIRQRSLPVASLDLDLSAEGIPSILMFPPPVIRSFLAGLRERGHTHFVILNSTPTNTVIENRLHTCWSWCQENRCSHEILNVSPDERSTADINASLAKHAILRRLETPVPPATVVVALTVWSALGALKAATRHKLHIGGDFSVAAINDETLSPWLNPSLTALRIGDPKPQIKSCIDWMLKQRPWTGPYLLSPVQTPVYWGESTRGGAGAVPVIPARST